MTEETTQPHEYPLIPPETQARRTIGSADVEIGHSETLGHFFAAFARMQGKLPAKADANAQGQVGGGRNDDGTNRAGRTYRYANIASVIEPTREHLAAEGLAVMGLPTNARVGFATVTLLIGHASGEWLSCTYHMPTGGKAQEHGSALTYCRRYMLTAILNTSAQGDDDDGKAASEADRPPHPNARRADQQRRSRPVDYFDPDEQQQQQQRPPQARPPARKADTPPNDDDASYNDFHERLTGKPAPGQGSPGADGPMTKEDWTQWQKRAIGQMGLTMGEVEEAAGGKIMAWPKVKVWQILDTIESCAKPGNIREMGRSDRQGIFLLVREQLTGGPPE